MAYTYPVASGVYGRAPAPARSMQSWGYRVPDAGSEDALQSNLLPTLRSQTMQDYGARVSGARRAAMDSNPDLAGYAGLNALLSGQGEASRSLSQATLSTLLDRIKRKRELTDVANRQAWEERMARLQHEWQMEQQRSANNSALWGSILGAGGTAAGAFL